MGGARDGAGGGRRAARARMLAPAAILAASLLLAPATAHARVTVSIEIAWGGVVIGGVGFFVYIGGAWEYPLAGREVPTALIEVRDGTARWGVPLPRPLNAADADAAGEEGLGIDLVRFRF